MSLTAQDLHAIRLIVQDETSEIVQAEVPPIIDEKLRLEVAPISVKLSSLNGKFDELTGEIKAVRNDVKAIYNSLLKAGIEVAE